MEEEHQQPPCEHKWKMQMIFQTGSNAGFLGLCGIYKVKTGKRSQVPLQRLLLMSLCISIALENGVTESKECSQAVSLSSLGYQHNYSPFRQWVYMASSLCEMTLWSLSRHQWEMLRFTTAAITLLVFLEKGAKGQMGHDIWSLSSASVSSSGGEEVDIAAASAGPALRTGGPAFMSEAVITFHKYFITLAHSHWISCWSEQESSGRPEGPEILSNGHRKCQGR